MDPVALIEQLEAGAAALAGVTAGLTDRAGRLAAGARPVVAAGDRLPPAGRGARGLPRAPRLHAAPPGRGRGRPSTRSAGCWRTTTPAREFAADHGRVRATNAGRSLEWLRGLSRPDWDAAYTHPKLGVIRAGDLLASWCAHDVLHLRQMARWHWRRLQDAAGPFGTGYAGQW